MFLINDTSKPETVVQKNQAELSYCAKSVAMGELLTAHRDCNDNPADSFTKVICSGKRRYSVNNILYDIKDGEFKFYVVASRTII